VVYNSGTDKKSVMQFQVRRQGGENADDGQKRSKEPNHGSLNWGGTKEKKKGGHSKGTIRLRKTMRKGYTCYPLAMLVTPEFQMKGGTSASGCQRKRGGREKESKEREGRYC